MTNTTKPECYVNSCFLPIPYAYSNPADFLEGSFGNKLTLKPKIMYCVKKLISS